MQPYALSYQVDDEKKAQETAAQSRCRALARSGWTGGGWTLYAIHLPLGDRSGCLLDVLTSGYDLANVNICVLKIILVSILM